MKWKLIKLAFCTNSKALARPKAAICNARKLAGELKSLGAESRRHASSRTTPKSDCIITQEAMAPPFPKDQKKHVPWRQAKHPQMKIKTNDECRKKISRVVN